MIRGYDKKEEKYILAGTNNSNYIRVKSDNKNIICPSCDGNLIFVNADKRIKHFRHKTERDCNFEPETNRHLEMKKIMQDKLNLDDSCLEVPLDFGTPDLLDNKRKVAIEVQHSSLYHADFMERTRNYNKEGYYPLWIFDWKLISNYIYENKKLHSKIRLPEFLKKAHKLYYGRIYCLKDDELYPLHFAPLQRWVKEFKQYGGYWKYYKRRKVLMRGKEIINYSVLRTENNKMNIARFYDKKFWGDEDEFKD